MAARKKTSEEKPKRSDAENQLLTTGLLLLETVYFQSTNWEVSVNSRPYLNVIAKMLTKYPKLLVEVGGHTENLGKDTYNMALSLTRAQSVMNYLRKVSPELRNCLSARGYGTAQSRAGFTSLDGRKQYRRTELQVLNLDALVEYYP